MMKYVDSSVVIGAYFPDDPHHKVSKDFMDGLSRGEFSGVISVFGLAEIAGFICRNSNFENAQRFLLELLRFPHLSVVYADDFGDFMNSVVLSSLARGLSGADSMHFTSTLSVTNRDEFVTLDDDFKRVSDNINVRNLRY